MWMAGCGCGGRCIFLSAAPATAPHDTDDLYTTGRSQCPPRHVAEDAVDPSTEHPASLGWILMVRSTGLRTAQVIIQHPAATDADTTARAVRMRLPGSGGSALWWAGEQW